MYTLQKELKQTERWLRSRVRFEPSIALILGSGLGFFAETIHKDIAIPYTEIPHFPPVGVAGHAGTLVFGFWQEIPLVIACGRHHFYEGFSLDEITFPVRLFRRLGAEALILTNSAGCAHPDYAPGEFMTITRHFPMVDSMLPEDYQGVEPSEVWAPPLAAQLRQEAARHGITVRNGAYAWTTGPSYETPAEVRYLRNLGADAIGMSTVPEAIAAAQEGLQVLGISCFTNYAAGLSSAPLSHEEVRTVADRVKEPFAALLQLGIELLSE